MTTQRSDGSNLDAGAGEEPESFARAAAELAPSAVIEEDAWRRHLAERMLRRAKTDGLRLVGPDVLLAGITKAALETAL
jgi:hypothetical protein